MGDPSGVTPAGSLPTYATRFVGRQAAVARIDSALAAGDRLLTVLGPAGVGKTRLVSEYARVHPERFSRVCFCDLTTASSAPGVCHALATAIDVPLDSGNAPGAAIAQLGACLAALGPALVLLDGFEHIVTLAPSTIAPWMAAAPSSRFLVTSRERLRIPGETVYDLEPLSLPEPHGAPGAGSSEAVELFLDRARAVRGDLLELDARDGAAVDRVVRRLDGMPLAIELAAARMRTLSAAELGEQISEHFDILSARDRGAPARQSTLSAAIDWSWHLLREPERRALMRCAVFRDGFRFDSATAVLSRPGERPVIDQLEDLKDKSLLRSAAGRDGGTRFAMYESIRSYALRRLHESGEGPATRRRHAEHFVALGETLAGQTRGRTAPQAHARLLEELGNLIEVHRWAREATLEPDERARFVVGATLASQPLLAARGPSEVYEDLFEGAVEAATADGADAPAADRLRLLLGRAEARLRTGRVSESLADLVEAESIARAVGDEAWRARVLRARGRWSYTRGFLDESQRAFEEALELSREHGDRDTEGKLLDELGNLKRLEAQLPQAEDLCRRALDRQREVEDRPYEAQVLISLGSVALDLCRLDEARELLDRALAIGRELGSLHLQGGALMDLGVLSQEQGRFGEARAALEASVACFRRLGRSQAEGLVLAFVGNCLEESGQLDEAAKVYDEAVATCRRSGNALAEGLSLGWQGRLLSVRGDLGASERALDAAAEVLERVGDRVRWEVVHLCRGHLDLGLARDARRAGDAAAAARHERDALHRTRAARGTGSVVDRSCDVRAALRMLDAALAELTPHDEPEVAGDVAGAAPEALVVASTGNWFRPPEGEVVGIERRGALRLLMQELSMRRRDVPGSASAVDDLFAVGWPGQKAMPRSAASRVYVAMSTLRGLGLRNVLRRQSDGYLIDPAIPIVIVEEPG